MKVRRLWMIQTLCLLGYWLVRALVATVWCKYWRTGRDFRPAVVKPHERCIFALWHEYLLVPMVRFSHPTVRLLVSHHADGQIVAEMCKHMRMGTVRGSTTRGGVEAVRQILRPSRYRSLVLTPDGPRGPRREAKPGIIYLAAKLGWPIIPVGVGYRKPWRLRSWDRLAIPKPYQRAVVMTAEPIMVPDNLDREGLELYRRKLEQVLESLTAQAERVAVTGRKPSANATAILPHLKAAA